MVIYLLMPKQNKGHFLCQTHTLKSNCPRRREALPWQWRNRQTDSQNQGWQKTANDETHGVKLHCRQAQWRDETWCGCGLVCSVIKTVVNTSAQSVTLTCVCTGTYSNHLAVTLLRRDGDDGMVETRPFCRRRKEKHAENVWKHLIEGEACNVLRKKQRHQVVTF